MCTIVFVRFIYFTIDIEDTALR